VFDVLLTVRVVLACILGDMLIRKMFQSDLNGHPFLRPFVSDECILCYAVQHRVAFEKQM